MSSLRKHRGGERHEINALSQGAGRVGNQNYGLGTRYGVLVGAYTGLHEKQTLDHVDSILDDWDIDVHEDDNNSDKGDDNKKKSSCEKRKATS